jgi:type II secretory pathway predicted ATPase ExeA
MVVRAAAAGSSGARFVTVSNPPLTRGELLRCLADGFGLSAAAAHSKTRFLSELKPVLSECLRTGAPAGLLVDEAQTMSFEVLDELRLLADMELGEHKLLPLVLAGQPELGDRLQEPALQSLKQRIVLRCSLRALTIRETGSYIAGRIAVAGGDAAQVFTADAVEAVHACSRGVPRVISVICDNALIAGFAAQERPVGRQTVLDVCADLDLEPTEARLARPVHTAPRGRAGRDAQTDSNGGAPVGILGAVG